MGNKKCRIYAACGVSQTPTLFIICGGAFCPHFLCCDFIVILFRFQISKNGGRKMEPFLNSGGAFRPQIVKVGALSAPLKICC